jgi:aminopeptidase-like protein
MFRLIRDLYPICRSLTGNGVRETLRILGRAIPLDVREVPTGRRVFDWTIPREWNIRDAYILAPDGRKIADFFRSNLHVVGYSVPVRARMTLAELRPHLHVHPERDDLVPYRTSPYDDQWGFCLSRREMDSLPEGEYEVLIDSTLEDGALTYGEYAIAGREKNEVLLSTHVCHPSLCNDNLSGIALVARLAEALTGLDLRYTYRFLFIPAMIGAIAWLQENEARAGLIRHGLVIACVGDRGGITYKRSRRGNALVDRAAAHVLATRGGAHEILDFSPDGYDERQFASPGFDLPVGWLTRTPGGRYPEYHSSGDDLSLVDPASLADSLDACLAVIDVLESDAMYRSTNMKCEPQLGRRGLYGAAAGSGGTAPSRSAVLWVLNFSDGAHSLLEIAESSGLPFDEVREAARALLRAGLLEPEAGR